MNTNALVVKSNALVEASFRLGLNEQRLILTCISQVRRDEILTDQVMYSISASEFSKICGVDQKTAYRELRTAALTLKRREVRITQEPNGAGNHKETLISGWVQSIKYSEKDGTVRLRFNHDIIPYLSELNRSFTTYKLKNVVRMSSSYGVRIYELLTQWLAFKEREVSITWLKESLQLEKKYPNIFDFKRRVLDPAIEDINKNSDLWVKWEQRKTGRKVTHIRFSFGLKKEVPGTKISGDKILGINKVTIEKNARPGETYEQAASRLRTKNKESVV